MEDAIEIAKEVLSLEASSLQYLGDNLDEQFQCAIDLILGSKGRVLVLGVGKSGHIGKKIAATLASTGQPAFFIHPTEAVHGDLGMMVAGDICLMISHTGNTSELLDTVPAIKRIGLPVISITSNPISKLARYSDIVLNTHVKQEACPFNLAPTNSTTVTLALGDAIAIALLKRRGFKEEQFAMRHPGGVLGKRLLTRVCDVMITDNLPRNNVNDTFKDALTTMTKGRQGLTIIVDEEESLVGVLTDGDLRRSLERYDKVSDIRLQKIFTKGPKTIGPDALATEALKMMQDNKITSVIVVDGRKIMGLIHIHHILEQGLY